MGTLRYFEAREWIRVEGTRNASSLQRFIRLLHSRGDSLPFRSTEKGKITQNQSINVSVFKIQ